MRKFGSSSCSLEKGNTHSLEGNVWRTDVAHRRRTAFADDTHMEAAEKADSFWAAVEPDLGRVEYHRLRNVALLLSENSISQLLMV